jgi:phosphate:Na+ symporter
LLLFPVVVPLLVRASGTIDGVTLLAAYHTAYNVVGVAVLLPLIDKFTRIVERILPERGSPLTRCLDNSALATPIAAVEAVRRTVARALAVLCESLDGQLAAAGFGEDIRLEKGAASVQEAANALQQAQEFMSEVNGPPESQDEQQRLTSTLHALYHCSRLAETIGEEAECRTARGGPEDERVAQLCREAMRCAASVAAEVATAAAARDHATPVERLPPKLPHADAMFPAPATSIEDSLLRLERCTKAIGELRQAHRSAMLRSAANGALSAGDAINRVDTVRRLEASAHHAWRATAHLVGRAKAVPA